jgi:phage gp36-like protein
MRSLYFSRPALACYEGEQAPPPAQPADNAPQFTQEAVNQILAADRRKHQAKIETLQKTLEDVSAGKHLPPRAQQAIDEQIESLKAENRTAIEQVQHEAKQREAKSAKELADEKAARAAVESLYHTEKIQRALTDAAVGNDAYQPGQILDVLRPYTRLEPIKDDKGKVIGQKVLIDFPDTDSDGQQTTVTHTPESAVRRMKELPKKYGNLFNSGVVSGVGSQATAGGPGGGPIDPRKLTQEQYLKIRLERPELLGLRPNKKR